MSAPNVQSGEGARPSQADAAGGRSFGEFEHAGWDDSLVVTQYDEHLSKVTTQSVDALLDAAGVDQGRRALDVATGAGYIAATAARRGADAIGIDFSEAQVRLARERDPSVEFQEGNAEALSFASESFDAVTSGFGICHLPDPDRALREAFRVLKHGGHVAFTVWDAPERAVVFGALYAAIRAHGTMDVDLPVGPNFFLFSDPAQSASALLTAGFVSVSSRQVPQVWRVTDPDDVFEVISRGTVRAAATLRAQRPSARQAIKSAMRDVVARYSVGDYFDVPAPAVLAAAVKP
jgi:ubiquinone/menaquinone biosynthesis C-methylase UbiE